MALVHVDPLHGVRLQRNDAIDERLGVLRELLGVEAQLADGGVNVPRLIVAELDFAALYSATVFATSGVTVPAQGDGIDPRRGPRTRPSGLTTSIMSGDAMQASKSIQPPRIF